MKIKRIFFNALADLRLSEAYYILEKNSLDLNSDFMAAPLWFGIVERCDAKEKKFTKKEAKKAALLFYELNRSGAIDINAQNLFGETALHITARAGERYFSEVLLSEGASPNIESDRHNTALSEAVIKENYPLAVFLVDKAEAKPNGKLIENYCLAYQENPMEHHPKTAFNFMEHYLGLDVNGYLDENKDLKEFIYGRKEQHGITMPKFMTRMHQR